MAPTVFEISNRSSSAISADSFLENISDNFRLRVPWQNGLHSRRRNGEIRSQNRAESHTERVVILGESGKLASSGIKRANEESTRGDQEQ